MNQCREGVGSKAAEQNASQHAQRHAQRHAQQHACQQVQQRAQQHAHKHVQHHAFTNDQAKPRGELHRSRAGRIERRAGTSRAKRYEG